MQRNIMNWLFGPWRVDHEKSVILDAEGDKAVVVDCGDAAHDEVLRHAIGELPEALTALQNAMNALDNAVSQFDGVCETHIYDEDSGDKHPKDCGYCASLAWIIKARDEAAAVLVNAIGEG